MSLERVAVIGPGRVGLTLARALTRAGRSVAVLGRNAGTLPDPLESVVTEWQSDTAAAAVILIAVPDGAIESVAERLASERCITAAHTVVHTSGIRSRAALAALEDAGAALGSWHPLQTFARRSGEPEALAGSPAVIEGDDRALATGRALAAQLHMRPVIELEATSKPLYHAAAVFACNYLVVLADIADRLTRDAIGEPAPATLFLPLMRRTLAHLTDGTAAALTGPLSRGDAGTIAMHLAALQGADRVAYLALADEALGLAVRSGLRPDLASEVERVLRGEVTATDR
ncbi:MAG: Rossmann-like and DUF2520 domain-containing protein [Gemmatimonadales bacterium]